MKRTRSPAEPADRFHGYLKDWILQQRAQHGEDAAKEHLRSYLDGVTDSIRVVGEFGPDGFIALQIVIDMVQANVLSASCPTCGAEIGDLCWSSTRPGERLARGAHHDRFRAARGEHVPQSLDGWLARRKQQESASDHPAEKKRGWSCK